MHIFSSNRLKIAKIAGLNLVVLLGVFLLDWDIFEVAVAFLLETGINFVVAAYFHYFVTTESKEPFLMATFSLTVVAAVISCFLALEAGLIHYLTGPKYESVIQAIGFMPDRISAYEFGYVITAVLVISLISYLIQKYYLKKVEKITIWQMLEKLFYIHVFIAIATIIYGLVGFNSEIGLLLFICAKIAIDYYLDHSKKEVAIKN